LYDTGKMTIAARQDDAPDGDELGGHRVGRQETGDEQRGDETNRQLMAVR